MRVARGERTRNRTRVPLASYQVPSAVGKTAPASAPGVVGAASASAAASVAPSALAVATAPVPASPPWFAPPSGTTTVGGEPALLGVVASPLAEQAQIQAIDARAKRGWTRVDVG